MHLRFSRLFAALTLIACSHAPTGTVTFGAAGPWHDPNGGADSAGVALALDELNATNHGVHYAVVFKDDSANGRRAATVARELVKDPNVLAVIGHVNSGAMAAAARVYDGNVPAIATAATSPALSGISKWTFRVISSDSLNGATIASYLSKMGRKRAAVLYENNAYGRGLADSFRRGFSGDIVGFDPVSDQTGENLEPFVSWYKQQKVDLVFVAGTAASGLAYVKEAKRQQMPADMAGGNGLATMTNDPSAEGVFLPTPFDAADQRPEVRAFVAAYQKKFGTAPSAYAALAYDATKLLAAAVDKVGPDRAKIRDYLAKDMQPYHGVTGTISFALNGDLMGKGMTIARIHNGAIQLEANQ